MTTLSAPTQNNPLFLSHGCRRRHSSAPRQPWVECGPQGCGPQGCGPQGCGPQGCSELDAPRELTSCSFTRGASGSARLSLLSASSLGVTIFPFGAALSGALEGSGAALGSGFSSAGAGGFFSAGAGLGVLLCSAARRLLAGEGCRSRGATGSVGAGTGAFCCWLAAGGWCRGEPVGGCFGAGIGIGAGSPRLPSSSRCVWQFKHSHSFFCKTEKGKVAFKLREAWSQAGTSTRSSADGTHGDGAKGLSPPKPNNRLWRGQSGEQPSTEMPARAAEGLTRRWSRTGQTI